MAQIFTNYIPLIYVGVITYACHKLSAHLVFVSNSVPKSCWEIWKRFHQGQCVVFFDGEYWNVDSIVENWIYKFIADTREIQKEFRNLSWTYKRY